MMLPIKMPCTMHWHSIVFLEIVRKMHQIVLKKRALQEIVTFEEQQILGT